MYMIIKHAHLGIIALTFIFFVINLILTIKQSDMVSNKVLKIGPHILYTIFVLSFVYLVIMNPLSLYPFVNGWATLKLSGFLLYILSITFALKWASSNLWRIIGLIGAVICLVLTAKVGFADNLKVKGASAFIDTISTYFSTIV